MRTTGEPDGSISASSGSTERGHVHRKCACADNSGAGGPCQQCSGERLDLQRSATSGAAVTGLPAIHEALRSPGDRLDPSTRAFFEPRFGRDLSLVRVHANPKAAESAHLVNALAYTVGSDIVFGAGQYDPGSGSGRRLLAHELAHVVQQGSGSETGAASPVVQRQPAPSASNSGAGGAGGAGGTGGAGPTAVPDTPGDPASTAPPPEHAERVERLQEMAAQIEDESHHREELQAQVRALPEVSSEETDAERTMLKGELTLVEQDLAGELEDRIALIDEAMRALEAVLPGSSPSPPSTPTRSDPADPGSQTSTYTVQSELYRLAEEKRQNEQQLLLIKRCLARKRIRQIAEEISQLPPGSDEAREKLEQEKAEQVGYLKSSVEHLSCSKSPSETSHPTEVSPGELEKIKLGEGFIPYPYVALEGEKKKSGGCTIGYGHVINANDHRTCEHDPVEPVQTDPNKKPLRKCICSPDWILKKDSNEAVDLLKSDIAIHIRWIKQHVLVDLDQGQFDALVDISLHVGSVPKSLLDVVNAKLCKDDEAVRQEYLKTALYIKDNKERGPVFKKRRQERVWAPKGDDDPNCL